MFEQVITSADRTSTYTEQHAVTPNYNYQSNPYYSSTPNPYNYRNSNGYNYNYNNQNYNSGPSSYNYNYSNRNNYNSQNRSSNSGYGYRAPAQQYRNENHTEQYAESTFTLNAIDRKQNKLVWTCTVQADIYDNLFIEKDVHPAVHSMLKTYPGERIAPEKGRKNKPVKHKGH